MYKKFISAFAWNSINVFIYKIILLLHQIILYYVMPHELYGVTGTLFAALYLLIGCTNFGFEYSLFTFFAQYTKSKTQIHSLINQCLVKTLCTTLTAIILGILITAAHHTSIATFFLLQFPMQLLPYLLAIFVTESLRKYLETIAQLAFLNKQIAITQIIMIISYTTMVWLLYFILKTISLATIFIPMAIVSCLEIIAIIVLLYRWHQTLPLTSPCDNLTTTQPSTKIKFQKQFFNYINQLSKNLFSPNFLLILIAWVIGMKQTGTIRYLTNVITLLYMLLSKVIAIPSGALFSNITHETFQQTKKLFLTITNAYIQFLYFLAIIITTTIVPFIIQSQSSTQTAYISLFFILAGFIEYITLTYEKLYIVQHATSQLALINSCSAMLCIIYLSTVDLNPKLFLLPICCIRFITICIIGFYTYRKWDIIPNLKINPKTITASLITLFIIYVAILMHI